MQLIDDTPDEPDAGGPPAIETSASIRKHAHDLATWLASDFGMTPRHRILEVASHGNILARILHDAGLRDTTTVESHPVAALVARQAGLHVVEGLLDPPLARDLRDAHGFDLVLDTFDLAHRRRPLDELSGIAAALAPDGRAVIEVEHALPVVMEGRFDSLRHGHFGYISLISLAAAAERSGLVVTDALRTSIYGGSLRVVLAPEGTRPVQQSVSRILQDERDFGLASIASYDAFAARVQDWIEGFRSFLAEARAAGRRLAAYGAPARGNTLLNTVGVTRDDIRMTGDRSIPKQGRELPGSRIPIIDPDELVGASPDDVVILTWPLADEVIAQLTSAGLRCRFVVPLPELHIVTPG